MKLGEMLLRAEDHQGEGPGGQGEDVQGGPLQLGGGPHGSV